MKILYVTTVGSTMGFFKSFIKKLIDEGHTVDIASNLEAANVQACYQEWGCELFQITTSRSPFSTGNIKAVAQIKKIVSKGGYDIVHCHTPLAAAATRIACIGARKRGVKVIYTAHGFHFYRGAPLKNWLIFYPIEKLCSYWTDVLITINKEDYALAQKKFHAKQIRYVPGVGIDVERFAQTCVDVEQKRISIGVPKDCFLMLSVGELNENKNHSTVIRALAQMRNQNIHYMIAGVGHMDRALMDLARELGVESQIHLLGYRTDIAELCKTADLFVFPSFREGLPVSVMEAMAAGLPCVVSDIRGNQDLVKNSQGGYLVSPADEKHFERAINELFDNKKLCETYGFFNRKESIRYDVGEINSIMCSIYNID